MYPHFDTPKFVKFCFSFIFNYLKNFMCLAKKVEKLEFWRALFGGEAPIVGLPIFVTFSLFLLSTHFENLIHLASGGLRKGGPLCKLNGGPSIGIARVLIEEGPNHKSHAITSSETSKEEVLWWQRYRRTEGQKQWPGLGT